MDLSGIVDGLAKIDPLNDLIDFGASLLGLPPAVKDVAKMAAGALTGDPLVLADGAVGLFSGGAPQSGPQTEYVPYAGGGGTPDPGYVPGPWPTYGPGGGPSGGPGSGGAALDPNIVQYRDCLRTLEANFGTFAALGGHDNAITPEGLMAVRGDSSASPQLKQAADFVLQHPEYSERLERPLPALLGGGGEDSITLDGIRTERVRVDQQISMYGMPGAQGTPPPGGMPPGGGPSTGGLSQGEDYVRNVLSNPNMSIEDKMEAVLQHISASTDDETEGIMQQMSALQDQRAGTRDEAQARKLDQSYEQLQLRLQQCMERRGQMFSLMSNVSEKFNEMAKVAIQNMARS